MAIKGFFDFSANRVTVSFVVLVHRAAQAADGVDGCFTRLGASACPENPSRAPPPPNKRAGGVATLWCITVNFGSIFVPKMLDPSGCFYFTFPYLSERVLLGSKQKIARLVANTITNKLYFKAPLKLHT